jgi:hypothetical protein
MNDGSVRLAVLRTLASFADSMTLLMLYVSVAIASFDLSTDAILTPYAGQLQPI